MNVKKKFYVPIKGITSVRFAYTTYVKVLATCEGEAISKALEMSPDDVVKSIVDTNYLECSLLSKERKIEEEVSTSIKNGKFIIDCDREVTVPYDEEEEKVS